MAQASGHAQSQASGPDGDKRRGRGHPAHDVFVSYSGYDKPVADAIVSRLEQAGIRCWVAPRDAIPGEFFGKSIVEAIENSRLMVIVLSGEANQSHNVLREVGYAVKNGVVVVPFRIETIEPTGAMAYYLGSEHWLDAMTPPLEVHIAHLVEVAHRVLDNDSAASGQAPEAAPSGPAAPAAPSSPAARPGGASSQPASLPSVRTGGPLLSGSPSERLVEPDGTSDVAGPGEPGRNSPGQQRRRYGKRRWIAVLAALAVVIGGAVGGWLATRPGGASAKQPVASSPSHPAPAVNPILRALTQTNSLKVSPPKYSPYGQIPPSKCHGQGQDTATCINPATGISRVNFRTYRSLNTLYAAYVAKVKSINGTFRANHGNCSNSQTLGERSWNHDYQHPLNYSLQQLRSGKLNGDQAAGRMFCVVNSSGQMVMVWAQNAGDLLGWLIGAPHEEVYQWWVRVHHNINLTGSGMHM
jgi:TIR domain